MPVMTADKPLLKNIISEVVGLNRLYINSWIFPMNASANNAADNKKIPKMLKFGSKDLPPSDNSTIPNVINKTARY